MRRAATLAGVLGSVVALVLTLVAFAFTTGTAQAAIGGPGAVPVLNKNDSWNICHRTNSDSNPYVLNSPNVDGIASAGKDSHLSHTGPVWNPTLKKAKIDWGDIVKPFEYNGTVYSQNWTAEGEAIFNNGCKVLPAAASAPTFAESACLAGAPTNPTITIPASPNVTYTIGGTVVAGTVSNAAWAGTVVTVTAVANPGYLLSGADTWKHTFAALATGCLPPDASTVTAAAPVFADSVCSAGAPTVPTIKIIAADHVSYKIDGAGVGAGVHNAVAGTTVIVTAKADLGYTLDGPSSWTHTFDAAATGCLSAAAVAPSFTESTCSAGAPTTPTITLTAAAGVSYEIDGVAKTAGTYPATAGSVVTVTAVAASPDYTLNGTSAWSHTFAAAPNCGGPVLPTAAAAAPGFAESVCVAGAPSDPVITIVAAANVSYQINGVPAGAGPHPGLAGTTATVTAIADPGYTLTGANSWTHTFAAAATCSGIGGVQAVTPNPVTFVDASCATESTPAVSASYTIPVTEHVTYRVGGVVAAAGSYPATDGATLTVTAEAEDGWMIGGDSSWSHTFAATPQCAEIGGVAAGPGPAAPAAVTTAPLASTGAGPIKAELGWALALILLGVGGVLAGRRVKTA